MRARREKGDRVFLERLRQLGFGDSGTEINGCGSSEIGSDLRTDRTRLGECCRTLKKILVFRLINPVHGGFEA